MHIKIQPILNRSKGLSPDEEQVDDKEEYHKIESVLCNKLKLFLIIHLS